MDNFVDYFVKNFLNIFIVISCKEVINTNYKLSEPSFFKKSVRLNNKELYNFNKYKLLIKKKKLHYLNPDLYNQVPNIFKLEIKYIRSIVIYKLFLHFFQFNSLDNLNWTYRRSKCLSKYYLFLIQNHYLY